MTTGRINQVATTLSDRRFPVPHDRSEAYRRFEAHFAASSEAKTFGYDVASAVDDAAYKRTRASLLLSAYLPFAFTERQTGP